MAAGMTMAAGTAKHLPPLREGKVRRVSLPQLRVIPMANPRAIRARDLVTVMAMGTPANRFATPSLAILPGKPGGGLSRGEDFP